jgi:hypothetical protein
VLGITVEVDLDRVVARIGGVAPMQLARPSPALKFDYRQRGGRG